MIKDRLGEVKKVHPNGDTADTNADSVDLDFEKIEFDADHSRSFVGQIFKKYEDVVNDFKDFTINMDTLKTMLEAKNAHNFNESEFNKLRQRNVQICNRVTGKFKKLEANLPKAGDFQTKARMKRSMYYGFFQQYIQLWAANEEILQKYEKQLKKNLQMQSKILNYDLTEEEMDMLIANKQTNLLVDNILTDTENARQQLQELKSRLSELLQLEKSISEVHGLFLKLQTLVIDQGDVLQRIENHFNDAQDYVKGGLRSIEGARQFSRKTFALKQKCLIIGIIITFILLLVIVNSFRCFMFCKKR